MDTLSLSETMNEGAVERRYLSEKMEHSLDKIKLYLMVAVFSTAGLILSGVGILMNIFSGP